MPDYSLDDVLKMSPQGQTYSLADVQAMRPTGLIPAEYQDISKVFTPIKNLSMGTASGFADIGNTLLNAAINGGEAVKNAVAPSGPSAIKQWNNDRATSLNDLDASMKDQQGFGPGRVLGNVLATYPVGGALGSVAKVFGAAPAVVDALTTAGMRAGTPAAGAVPATVNMLTRSGAGAVTGGTSAALVNPDSAETGAVLGAALPPSIKALGAGGGAVIDAASNLGRALLPSASVQALADKAINTYGIPLGLSDVGGKFTKTVKSVLNDLPLVGGIGADQKQAQQAAFNQAVGNTFGANADSLTPNVMIGAKANIGNALDKVWDNNALKIDPQLVSDLSAVQQRAASLNPDQQKMVSKQVQNLLQQVNANGEVPGSFANNWQSELRLMGDGEKGLAQSVLGDLRKAGISAFNRSVSGPDAAALAQARGQYKAYKTVEPMLTNAAYGVAGRVPGDVPAALLPQQVASQYGMGGAGTPLGDLSQIGSRFMVDRVPLTGGSTRAGIQNLLTGGLLGGVAMTSPIWGAVGGAAGLGVGAGLQRALGSPEVLNSLLRPAAPQTPGLLSMSLPFIYRGAPVLTSQ